jgi:hypothetical protein
VGSQGSRPGLASRRGWYSLAAALVALAGGGCATPQPGEGREAQVCRAAETEVAGYLEAKKRLKGPKARYVTSLRKLPKDAHVPEQVNGYPLNYTRTRKGFILECRYGKEEQLTSCTLNQAGAWECRRVVAGE